MDLLDQITQEAKKAGTFVAEKAIFVKDYAKNTWDAAEIRNKMNDLYKAIGKAVFHAETTEADTAEEINGYIEDLKALDEALKEKTSEKESLVGKKYCPACGKSADKKAAFCPKCGAKL
ncbi:MAG: zinc-ribbon domain-containing protein [Clostridia bacterium]|nr:zinc-ribbon domain-containing protein [Clostridia bacterium]